MRQWTNAVSNIIKRKRKDPTAIHAVPFPLKYDEFGANPNKLGNKEMMEYASRELLDASGYPVELFKGTLAVQQIPTAIRLFENQHWHIMHGFNTLSQWVAGKVTAYLGLPKMIVNLMPPSIADDVDKQAMRFNLGMSGELPRKSFWGSLGITEPEERIRERMEEDLRIEKARMEQEQEFKRELEGFTAGGEGGGEQGGGTTPLDVEERAMQEADRLMAIPSDGERRKAMDALRAQDIQLYSMAKEIMEQKRRKGESQGRSAVNEQAQQG
jgi:hypothetical protein